MHPRIALPLLLGAFAMLAPLSVTAQTSENPEEPEHPRRSLFTEEELAEFERIAAAQAAERETAYIQVSNEDEVIELEPYIVEGDDWLLLARVRRELENVRTSSRRLLVGANPALVYAARFGRTGDDAFFHGYRLGLPDGKLTSGINLVHAPVAIAQAVRDGNLIQLFDAPPDAAGTQ